MTKFVYVQEQLDAAVNFISKNNPHGFSKDDVYGSIMDTIKSYVDRGDVHFAGTMGYLIKFTEDFPNRIEIEILVDPALGMDASKYITMEGDRVVDVEYVEI